MIRQVTLNKTNRLKDKIEKENTYNEIRRFFSSFITDLSLSQLREINKIIKL